jgi:hypothetical protein
VRGEDIGEDDLQRMRGSPGAGRVAERGRERGRGEGEGEGGKEGGKGGRPVPFHNSASSRSVAGFSSSLNLERIRKTTYIYVFKCMYVLTYVHARPPIYTHVHMHVCTYIHMYTQLT